MKLIFAGTPEFSAVALDALIDAGHEIVLVLTQPDRPSGRGMRLKASPVKTLALAHGLRVEQPLSLKAPASHALIAQINADVMVVAAYGLLLPEAILTIPRYGCLNIHASLLPRWRGAAPIQRALQAGDSETGITIMQMDVGLDTGDMISVHPLPISEGETGASLTAKLAALGAQAIVSTLSHLEGCTAVPQPLEGVSYATKLSKHEAQIDWQRSADEIVRCIHAFNPVPGAYTVCDGDMLKVWRAYVLDGHAEPGRIVTADANHVVVGSGTHLVAITELQRAGGKRVTAREFSAGRAHLPGTLLGHKTP